MQHRDFVAEAASGAGNSKGHVAAGFWQRLLGAAAVAALLAAPSAARAQATPFTAISGFGDSYADTGFAPGGAFRMLGFPCPVGPFPYPTCRFSGGTNFVDSLQSTYGLAGATNYAIGGALTNNTNAIPGLPGFAQEVAGFVASGRTFGPRDLIALSIGGNDQGLFNSGNTLAQINAQAVTSAANAFAGVQQLIARGANNIAWVSPGNPFYFPTPFGDPLTTPAQRAEWAHTYYQQVQQLLAPAARSGVRIFLFDFETLQARIAANPGQYGFASAGGCQPTLGVPGCVTASSKVQNSFFYWDSIHPTSAGFALIANYMANQINAPTTITPQGGIVLATAGNFAESTFGHLDAYRNFSSYGAGGAYAAYAADRRMPAKALPAARPEANPWSAYGEVNYAGGTRDGQLFGASANFNSLGGTAGVEYQVRPDWKLGAVFSYAQPNASLGVQNAHLKIDALQFGGYSSHTSKNWFADFLLAYGYQQLNTDRLGVIDVIHGSTNANLFTVAAKAGYLFDVASLRVGPIGGLNYTNASIAGYTETGDVLLTQIVGKQTIDSLTGSAGVQFRLPFTMSNALYSPFVNVTAEHDFLGDGRIITTTQSTTLLLPVMTPTNSTNQTYGRLLAGVAGQLAGNVSGMINAYTTFARSDGNFYGVNAGIKVAF